jgi:caffeoyl-CoA O-methyltransferase
MDFIPAPIERYAYERTKREPEPLPALATATAAMPGAGMLTGRVEGRFLCMLVKLLNAKRVLELGTFTGYSALSMAEGLPADGQLITCELDQTHADIARSWFARSVHGAKIELRLGPALGTIASLEGSFDLAFIDADKENYPAYYQACLAKLRSGGLLVIDNTLWSGKVLSPSEPSAQAIDSLNRIIERDERVDNVLLTVRDGVHLVRKR